MRADLQNLGLIMRVAKRMAPGMDAKAMTREIRERLTDELDYEHEAQQHRAFARSWRGHPFIYVPSVVTELSTEHVLVSEEEIEDAFRFLYTRAKLAVEPAAAVAAAARLNERFQADNPVLVVSGGNVVPEIASGILGLR